MMKFDCEEIEINNLEIGCNLTLSEKLQNREAQLEMPIDELIDAIGDYVLLQRTYPLDNIGNDFYYFETSNPEISGELVNFTIDLFRTKFLMIYHNETIEIEIKTDDAKFEELKNVLKKITNDKGKLIIHE